VNRRYPVGSLARRTEGAQSRESTV
jgi:hypothetical protein